MHQPARPTPERVSRRRGRRHFWLAAGVVLALFLLFEVGIRHVPPDGMTVTYDCPSFCVNYPFVGARAYTAPQDQQFITQSYAYYNSLPVIPAWTPIASCGPLAIYPSSVVFSWHGIPVESWTSRNCLGEYIESAGGISDSIMLIYH